MYEGFGVLNFWEKQNYKLAELIFFKAFIMFFPPNCL
jgi:hypothetical protein